MAELIDEVLVNELEASSLNDMVKSDSLEEPKVKEKVETNPIDEEVPDKYRGKSLKDIVAMHQEAEKLIGRQGSEVGDLRKIVDDFIKTQTTKDSKVDEVATTDEDFFIEPKSAVNRAIDNHPAIKEAQHASLSMKRAETVSRLKQEFPDAMEVVQSPDFAKWIEGSKVRTELFVRAETQYDYDSAKELLDNWKERQTLSKKVTETSKVDRDQQLKAADIGNNNGTSETVAKKKYRRQDIMKLMTTDPDRYDAMSNEIMAAYREGRVI
ncbi:hypothetical protein UFOVP369_35 [uncultured Caudovirales phage]|uniref:Uncharacterized protein n=1 Tax=uncultured Caudovirales phage TaxID=2100421 RepID=A0A6J7X171_9CAUD|nr:hypothetical protein UFOVP369_35 [uncultured Caudovirales phage]